MLKKVNLFTLTFLGLAALVPIGALIRHHGWHSEDAIGMAFLVAMAALFHK